MKIKRIISFICIILSLLSLAMPVSANSAQQYWYGVDAFGAVISGESSPIVVEKELLTFDISEFPSNHYYTEEEFSAYQGKVTAKYTFYNPSDITVTATLAFPFGNLPSYACGSDEGKYKITANGEELEAAIRHTLTDGYDSFDLDTDLPLICDEYIDHEFYTPDLTVTRYKWSIEGIKSSVKMPVHIAFDISKGDKSRVYYLPDQNNVSIQDDGDYRIGSSIRNNGSSIELYVFGQPLTSMPDWKLYENGSMSDGEEISGRITLTSTETMRFEDFALSNFDEDIGASEIDWYNAVVTDIVNSGKGDDFPVAYSYRLKNSFGQYLMRWYQYEITLAPKARVVNEVTAPIYPAIDAGYVPPVFEYTYLLSPASSWTDFGNLDIIINTPYYLTESSIEGWSKTDYGYELNLDGLPEGELVFTLSTNENPTLRSRTPSGIAKRVAYFVAYYLPIILIALAVITIVIAAILIIRVLIKKKEKQPEDDADDNQS